MQLPHAADTTGYWDSVETGACSACHTLKPDEADPQTAHIALVARTLSAIKTVTKGATPANLGCLFCHDRKVPAERMVGVLSQFASQRSQHPIGRTFTGPAPYADTDNLFLSSYGSDTANEMDCLDCHDADLVAPGGRYFAHRVDRERNPFMLKNVSAPGQYDELCRSCHGSAAPPFKGKDVRVRSHADGSPGNPLAEVDGTLLQTSDPDQDGDADELAGQCTVCHAAHSSPNAKLFVSSFANGTDCTSICHAAGDRLGNFTRTGHGKPRATYARGGVEVPLNFACTRCHDQLDVSTPNAATSPPRPRHADRQPADGDRAGYRAAFNLTIGLRPTDGGTETGNPELGVCQSCHPAARYAAHLGYAGQRVGCQDCHDEHGEGAGTENIFMIPTLAKRAGYFAPATRVPPGQEEVTYTAPRFAPDGRAPSGGKHDFYRRDGAGVCDNTECHGTALVGEPGAVTAPGPLQDFLDSGSHSGGVVKPAEDLDCGTCHTHGDLRGSFGALGTCEACHASRGRTHRSATGSVATHAKHVTAAPAYVAGCQSCHAHDGKSVPPDTDQHGDGTVDFGGPEMPSSFSYTESFDDAGCASNRCHAVDGPGKWRIGLGASGCEDCHLSGASRKLGAASAPTSGLHAPKPPERGAPRQAHDGSFEANADDAPPGSGTCVTCHTTAPSGKHVDGTLQLHFPVVNIADAVGFRPRPAPSCLPRGELAACHEGDDEPRTWR